MASLDFIYDITEKLDNERLSYIIVTLHPGRKSDRVDVFYRIDSERSKQTLVSIFDQLETDLKVGDQKGGFSSREDEDEDEDDDEDIFGGNDEKFF